MKAFLSIGTNMGDRLNNLQNAVDSLKLLPETSVTEVSPVYETDPWGFEEQANFLNIAVEIETDLTPESLLGALLGIEAALGRVRLFKNGPRVIDLDLLLFGDEKINNKVLVLPHPRMFEREFVLQPLSDLKSMNGNEKIASALAETASGKARLFDGKIRI